MKITVIFLVLFSFGCSTDISQTITETTGFSIEGVLQEVRNLANDFLQKFNNLFNQGTSQLPYCDVVVEHSPTLEDYQRSWQNDHNDVFCPEWGPQKTACLQKRKEAFFTGLLCYRH